MGVIFEVPGWKEFTERCQGVVDSFEAKKLVLMRRMSNICLEEDFSFDPGRYLKACQ